MIYNIDTKYVAEECNKGSLLEKKSHLAIKQKDIYKTHKLKRMARY